MSNLPFEINAHAFTSTSFSPTFQTSSAGCLATFSLNGHLATGSYTLQTGLVNGYPYWKMDHPTRNFHVFRRPDGQNWLFSGDDFDQVKRLKTLKKANFLC